MFTGVNDHVGVYHVWQIWEVESLNGDKTTTLKIASPLKIQLKTAIICIHSRKICTKTAGLRVSTRVRIETRTRNEVSAELKVGKFVMFDAHDVELEPIWLGRVMSNPEWNGHDVYKNDNDGKLTFKGVGIGKGEVAANVMWYEKINVMSDKLEYWVSRSETEPIVQNNKYLLPITKVKMNQVVGQPNRVPMLRTVCLGWTTLFFSVFIFMPDLEYY